jgi:hypothetical protein
MNTIIKSIAAYICIGVISIILIEIVCSIFILHRTWINRSESTLSSNPKFATLVIFQEIYNRANNVKIINSQEGLTVSPPGPVMSDDKKLGWVMNPGQYLYRFSKKIDDQVSYLVTKVTINKDHTRYVGSHNENVLDNKNVYIFGDSFVFGEGVNDEQTFGFLLQNTFRDMKFHLYAAGGYSLTQAYVNFQGLKKQITKNDVIILGYADFYKVRHVLAPSRLREYGEPPEGYIGSSFRQPRALLVKGELKIDYSIPMFCRFIGNYCQSDDPPLAEMNSVTAAIINNIANHTEARVIIVHFEGDRNDQVLNMLDKKIEIVSATDADFDYRIRDDIMGFDRHPGPYWHYAIFSKIKQNL